jgi:hypothetical protein
MVAAPNLNRPGGAFPDGAASTAITSLLHTGCIAYLDAYFLPSEPETNVSLTLSGILELTRSAAEGSPGLQPGDLVLIEVVLEGGRLAGWACFPGRWQSAEALDVDGDGSQNVLKVGLVLSSVAAASHAVAVDELVDRAFHSGAHRVAGLPLGRLLLGADAELQVAECSWGKADVAGAFSGGCGSFEGTP